MKKQILALTDYHTDETIDFACKKYLESRGYFVAEKDTDGLVDLNNLPSTYLKVWNKDKKDKQVIAVIGTTCKRYIGIKEDNLWQNAKAIKKK